MTKFSNLALLIVTFYCLIASCKKGSTIENVDPGIPGTVINDKAILNGYTDKQSYNVGDSVKLFISANKTYQQQLIDVADLNGKSVFTIPFSKIIEQGPNGEKPYEDGFNYSAPLTFKIPELKSGIYLVAKQIPIIVKSKSAVDFTIVYPYHTENAYCATGRRSLYTTPVARKVSYLRPIPYTQYAAGIFKWLTSQNYTYNVIADIDLDEYDNLKGKVLMIVGHSEYWSRAGRRNFDRFVSDGKNAIVLSGNTMWWQVRFNEEKNQIICFKGSQDEPPVADTLKTWIWVEKRLQYPIIHSIGCDFDRGGYGQSVKNEGWAGFKVVAPTSPLFAGTGLKKGELIHCPTNEYDGAPLKGFDKDGIPIVDNGVLKFDKVELVGYDFAWRTFKTTPTAIIFRKKKKSGIVINIPSTNWCTTNSFAKTDFIPKITKNAIDGLIANKNMFSE